jgi:hypothetical protein
MGQGDWMNIIHGSPEADISPESAWEWGQARQRVDDCIYSTIVDAVFKLHTAARKGRINTDVAIEFVLSMVRPSDPLFLKLSAWVWAGELSASELGVYQTFRNCWGPAGWEIDPQIGGLSEDADIVVDDRNRFVGYVVSGAWGPVRVVNRRLLVTHQEYLEDGSGIAETEEPFWSSELNSDDMRYGD